jgi:TolB protein
MNTPINLPPPEEQNTPSCLYKIGYFLITAAIIVGLLSTTIAAAVWLYQEYVTTEEPPPVVIVEQTSITSAEDDSALGRIAFINADGQVETMDRAGENGRLLTNENRQYFSPTWSPNGRFIATLSDDGVYKLQDETGTDVQTLYQDPDDAPVYLYWSPDSSQLGFLAQQNRGELGLFIAPVSGDEVALQAVASPLYWDWSPTEDQILLHGNGSGPQADLLLMETGIGVTGIPIAQPGAFQTPAFSANGRFYAYAEEQSGGLSWLVVTDTRPPTLAPRRIEERHTGMVAMGWSPVADQLAYISGEHQGDGFHGALRLLDVDSGESRLLSSRQVAAFFWSPNGRFIATLTATAFDDGIYANGRVGLMQTHEPIILELAIIDVESGERTKLTTFQPTTHFLLQFMPYFDQYARSHRLWSPDSAALVLPMVIDNEMKVVVVGTNGRWQEIADGTMPFWSWQ